MKSAVGGAVVLFCAVALLCADVRLRARSPEFVSLLDLDRSEPVYVLCCAEAWRNCALSMPGLA